VWLDPQKTSPYAFYQFWLNTADADVYRFLRYYSFLSLTEIQAIEDADNARNGKPEAQRILAEQMTRLVHGNAALAQAQRISEALFSGDPRSLTPAELAQLELDGIPRTVLETPVTLIDALVDTGLADSRRRAREFLSAGAVLVNGDVVLAEDFLLDHSRTLYNRYLLLRRGKKQFQLLCLK